MSQNCTTALQPGNKSKTPLKKKKEEEEEEEEKEEEEEEEQEVGKKEEEEGRRRKYLYLLALHSKYLWKNNICFKLSSVGRYKKKKISPVENY